MKQFGSGTQFEACIKIILFFADIKIMQGKFTFSYCYLLKLYLTLYLLGFAFQGTASSATKLIDYGFEDWTGDADTTPSYIYSTSHWSDHENSTHVVNGTCGGVAPRSGSYYFHQQHYAGIGVGDDPCLGSSDDPASVNPHTLIDIPDMGEIFLHFYFQTNSHYGEMAGGNRLKWIELIGNSSEDGWAHFSSDGGIHMYSEPIASWGAKVPWPGGNPHGDGSWHSFAMYINISTGEQSVWLDTTDWSHPTVTRSYTWGGTTRFTHMVMSENFSSDTPSQSCWVKFDDVQVWDGIPDSQVIGLTSPSNLRIIGPN